MKWIPFAVVVAIAPMMSATAQAGPQQERMKQCNQEAKTKTLKGEDRKASMKTCLSGPKDSATSRQKTCADQAQDKGLKADARKQFIQECAKA